ncbi:MAG: hypothetical protein LUG99_00455 [Lachnospiraceae bacterium]|nr:hypothetical protein [Lachnospiraceae bacterium]
MAVKKNTAADTTETAETAVTVETAGTTGSAEGSVSTGSKTVKKAEALYTADEFARAAGKVFGKKYNSDIVRAAFKVAKKTTATKAEAVEIVQSFAERKVK